MRTAQTDVRFTTNGDHESGHAQTAMSALPPESGHVRCD